MADLLNQLYKGARHTILYLKKGNIDAFSSALVGNQKKDAVALLKSCADDGPPIHNQHVCRSVDGGLFELKPEGVRILFFWQDGNMILTNAFYKGTPKLQQDGIKRGKKLKAEFEQEVRSNK